MTNNQTPSKEEILKAIERLEKNQDDKVGILTELGITAVGAVGAGATAAALGTTTAAIPIVTALTGIGMVVAAPVTLVAGAAIAGGAAFYGAAQLLKDSGSQDGKRKEILNQYRERLKDIEAKERSAKLNEDDKTQFYLFLKEPLKHGLLSVEDAHQLMQAVENGSLSLSDAYRLIGDLLSENPVNAKHLLAAVEKQIAVCPNCSHELRPPTNRGERTLRCPKCQHSWQWSPKVP